MLLELLNTAGNYLDPLSKIGAGFAALHASWLWLMRLSHGVYRYCATFLQ